MTLPYGHIWIQAGTFDGMKMGTLGDSQAIAAAVAWEIRKLREHPRNRRLTTQQLADAAGISKSALDTYLAPERTGRVMPVGVLMLVCEALGSDAGAVMTLARRTLLEAHLSPQQLDEIGDARAQLLRDEEGDHSAVVS